MARLMQAQAVVVCDLSGFTEFFNSLDPQEMVRFGEIYEGFLQIFITPQKEGFSQKYLANRMGDGFLWLDFLEDGGRSALTRFVKGFLEPKCVALIKSVKVAVAEKPGLRGVRIAVVTGPFAYLETRLEDKVVGQKSISRLDFLAKEINMASRILNLSEAEDFLFLCEGAFYEQRLAADPEEARHFRPLGWRKLKGLDKAVRIYGYRPKAEKLFFYPEDQSPQPTI